LAFQHLGVVEATREAEDVVAGVAEARPELKLPQRCLLHLRWVLVADRWPFRAAERVGGESPPRFIARRDLTRVWKLRRMCVAETMTIWLSSLCVAETKNIKCVAAGVGVAEAGLVRERGR